MLQKSFKKLYSRHAYESTWFGKRYRNEWNERNNLRILYIKIRFFKISLKGCWKSKIIKKILKKAIDWIIQLKYVKLWYN